jgi:hypothetical protein
VEIFFRKSFARAIPTAQIFFCQVAELLMPREWCRKSDSAVADVVRQFFVVQKFSWTKDRYATANFSFA